MGEGQKLRVKSVKAHIRKTLLSSLFFSGSYNVDVCSCYAVPDC